MNKILLKTIILHKNTHMHLGLLSSRNATKTLTICIMLTEDRTIVIYIAWPTGPHPPCILLFF